MSGKRATRSGKAIDLTAKEFSLLEFLATHKDIVVDRAARMPGRGAYLCDGPECAAALSKAGRLNQAFRKPCVMDGIDLMSGR